MPRFRGSIGQLLVDETLPEPMRGQDRVLDKKGLGNLLRELARNHPEHYRVTSKRLSDLGRMAATATGGYSFGPEHLAKTATGLKHQQSIETSLHRALDDDSLKENDRNEAIIEAASNAMQSQTADVYRDALASGNPLAQQVLSGSRGNQMNLSSLLGSDVLYTDHHGNVIPLPVTRSYSQGLTPEQYWAGTYGARRGVLATKFAVRDAGALSKQLGQISHRLVVTRDDDRDADPDRGLPVDSADEDSEGALLARKTGPYSRNTVLTPKILKHLGALGHARILVRSPAVGGPAEGGVSAYDAGVREYGTLPGRGELIGPTSAQSLGEPLAQGSLSSKHSGGVAGADRAVSGFQAVNQTVQVPKTFKGGATHAEVDGVVQDIREAPAGGQYVTVDGTQHYVPRGANLFVKKHDRVEAGDALSDGLPNPSVIVEHKGIGEGRRYFTHAMGQAMQSAGVYANRRNLELLARGLIDHVELTEETEEHVPGDIAHYQGIESNYTPRTGAVNSSPDRALGKYLEKPVLHYSIGTKIRPSVVKDLRYFGIKSVKVHDRPPPFKPVMIRAMASIAHDPDWMTRLYGSGQKASLLDAVYHGGTSDEEGTSFVPALARAVDFGRHGKIHTPLPGKTPKEIEMPKKKPMLDLKAISPGIKFSAYRDSLTEVSQINEANQFLEKIASEYKLAEPINDKLPEPPSSNVEGSFFHSPSSNGSSRHAFLGLGHSSRPVMPQINGATLQDVQNHPGQENSWATYGHVAGTPGSLAPARPAQSSQESSPLSEFGINTALSGAQSGITGLMRRGWLGQRMARWAGPARAGAGAAALKTNVLINAGVDAAGHAREVKNYYGGVLRGTRTGGWDRYNQASQQNAQLAKERAEQMGGQGFLANLISPFMHPVTTAQGLAGVPLNTIEAKSDLDQEKLRSARLDQQLAARNKNRLEQLKAKAQSGQELTPGERTDQQHWQSQVQQTPQGPLQTPESEPADFGAMPMY